MIIKQNSIFELCVNPNILQIDHQLLFDKGILALNPSFNHPELSIFFWFLNVFTLDFANVLLLLPLLTYVSESLSELIFKNFGFLIAASIFEST